jgi:hypothetical protein
MQVKRNSPTSHGQARSFWEIRSSKGKKEEKTRLTLGRIAGSLQLHLVRIEGTVTLSTSDNEVNKITPLYIMSKKGGNCSVKSKKN